MSDILTIIAAVGWIAACGLFIWRLYCWDQTFWELYYESQKDDSEDSTAEPVPTVRCKNCLYWVSGENECESWEWCKMLNTDMPADGFCKYGAREEENDVK